MDEAARVRQGANQHVDPALLARLASDPSVTVRSTVALNPATPRDLDAVLAEDPDDRVRALLGRKLAALLPGLDPEAQATLHRCTLALLTRLVEDEADRVRASVAEALKAMPAAPRALILRLAHDPAIMVAAPVILFSPVLTSQDLVRLIVAAPSADTVTAVARRSGIDQAVSQAVVDAACREAITALLENPSAQITEATLDALATHAGAEVSWQPPLVRHRALSPAAARTLSQIVTSHLLAELAARTDLDPALAEELRGRIDRTVVAAAKPASEIEAAWRKACVIRDTGRLKDDAFIEAARRGEAGLMGAMLALRASVPAGVVERAIALRSPKGLIALAWRGGLSMHVAQALQIVLGRLPPDQLIGARPGGGFPLSQQEMRWQLEFMFRAGR